MTIDTKVEFFGKGIAPDLARNRPGKPLSEWQLFKPRMQSDGGRGGEVGVRTPDGRYFPFIDNEEIVFIKSAHTREPRIKLKDGETVPFSAWEKVRLEGYRQSFEKVHPSFGKLYTYVLAEHPELEQLGVVIGTEADHEHLGTSPGTFWFSDADHPNPYVTLHKDSAEHLDMEEPTRRAIAEVLWVNEKVFFQEPRILQTFTLLHELGHAKDYIVNYLNSDRAVENQSYDPARAFIKDSNNDKLSLLIPGVSPSRIKKMEQESGSTNLTTIYSERRLYYQAKGIHSPQELFDAIQVQYRKLPHEKFADEFAAKFMKKYWKQLEFGQLTNPT